MPRYKLELRPVGQPEAEPTATREIDVKDPTPVGPDESLAIPEDPLTEAINQFMSDEDVTPITAMLAIESI